MFDFVASIPPGWAECGKPVVQVSMEKDPRTQRIIGAAMEVHRTLGHGFLEAVYREALDLEMSGIKIPFAAEVELPITYKEIPLRTCYCADFVCYGSIVVEIKALTNMSGTESSQIINYLKAIGQPIGLLINFGKPSLEVKRFIQSWGRFCLNL